MAIQIALNGVMTTVTKEQVYSLVKRGQIRPDMIIYVDGQPLKASQIKGLGLGNSTPPLPPLPPDMQLNANEPVISEEQYPKKTGWLRFLDIRFTRFFTNSLIPVIWALHLIFAAIYIVFYFFSCLSQPYLFVRRYMYDDELEKQISFFAALTKAMDTKRFWGVITENVLIFIVLALATFVSLLVMRMILEFLAVVFRIESHQRFIRNKLPTVLEKLSEKD
ncbi:MAG: DUF4282 domain-containing protein [Planctomycetaceae bacterium]|jgi:hypothetical protein|nr:DUF4282 domain-containing protein [Planctomycetaceae bacterium]